MCIECDEQWNKLTQSYIQAIFTAGNLNLLHQLHKVIQNSNCHFLSSIMKLKEHQAKGVYRLSWFKLLI